MFGQQAFGMNHSSALINPYSYNRPLQSLSQDNPPKNSFPGYKNNNYNFSSNSPNSSKDKSNVFNYGGSQ